MKNITEKLDELFLPTKALVIYTAQAGRNEEVYVEAYDMDRQGYPANAHPLTVQETIDLAECLAKAKEVRTDYLRSKGLLPDRLLHLCHQQGCALWHTPAQRVNLLFKDNLTIPCGEAAVPAMVWKADRQELSVFALKKTGKPQPETPLYRMPLFNIYENGTVCMGNVEIEPYEAACLEDFMHLREQAFWNSYFSHLLGSTAPIKGNIVQLWQGLVGTDKAFPNQLLVKQGTTLKELLA